MLRAKLRQRFRAERSIVGTGISIGLVTAPVIDNDNPIGYRIVACVRRDHGLGQ
jgi:hypothetical protein